MSLAEIKASRERQVAEFEEHLPRTAELVDRSLDCYVILDLIALLEEVQRLLEEIIYVPGENGPVPGSNMDRACELAEDALARIRGE